MQIEFVSVQSLPRISGWFSSAGSVKGSGSRVEVQENGQLNAHSEVRPGCREPLQGSFQQSSNLLLNCPTRAALGAVLTTLSPTLPFLCIFSPLADWVTYLNPAMNERGYLLMDGWNEKGNPKLPFVVSFLPMWTRCPSFSFCLKWLPPWTLNNSESSLPRDQKMCIKRFRETACAYRISLPLFNLHCSGY